MEALASSIPAEAEVHANPPASLTLVCSMRSDTTRQAMRRKKNMSGR